MKPSFETTTAILRRHAVAGVLALVPLPLFAAEVDISYEEPERFSDMAGRGSPLFHERTFERFQRELESEAEKLAEEYLPSGTRLTMLVRDVDLAGEFEPWRRMASDVRVLRDIYPPRLKFHYGIRDEAGEIVREGVAQLSDMNYLWGANVIRDHDDFHYEKELLRNWARKALSDLEMPSAVEPSPVIGE